jgi:signal transduction histidine kinase
MKEFSHPGSTEKTPADLNRALETTLTICRNEWKYVAEVVTDFEPDPPLVPCLTAELNQVFLNLVVNAAQAIAEKVGDRRDAKGTITVRTRRQGDWFEIQIADTGPGIPEHVRPRIFEPFFTTKPVGKGTGQGLALARSIVVDKHGGTISFDTQLGQGTTFTIRLPLQPTQAAAPAKKAA